MVDGGWTKTKLMLNSTQVEVEDGVELGKTVENTTKRRGEVIVSETCNFRP